MYTLLEHEFAQRDNGLLMFTSHATYQKKMLVIFKRNVSQNHLVDTLAFKGCDRAECYVSDDMFKHPMFALHCTPEQREPYHSVDEVIRMYVFVNGLPYAPVKYTSTVVDDVNKWLSVV